MQSEKQIEDELTDGLRRVYGAEAAFNQVYVAGKRIDIILKRGRADELIAIEVKIKDWKTALRQANLNLFAVDKSYVAICSKHAMPAIKNVSIFASHGIGLIIISPDNSYKVLLEARDENYSLSNSYKSNLLSSLTCSMA